MSGRSSRWALVVHPLLFAAWLPLFVGARNLDEDVSLSSVALWIAGYCAGALCLWLVALGVVRDPARASLLTTFSILSFLAYPFVDDWASGPGGWAIAARLGLVALWLAACAVVVRRPKPAEPLALALTYSGLIAVLLAALPIVGLALGGSGGTASPRSSLKLVMPAQPPDIYYLILDGYGRDDVLREYYGYDNSAFLENLESLGFFVARASRSNYNQTRLSIPSSLNMDYLGELLPGREALRRRKFRSRLRDLVRDALVASALDDLGYRVEVIPGAWGGSSRSSSASKIHHCRGLSDFGVSMVERSALRLWSDLLVRKGRRQQILCQYAVLEGIAGQPGPKFVFSHIVSPHGPWLFDRHGGPAKGKGSLLLGATSRDRARYIEQVAFNNTRLLGAIGAILGQSASPPVIVLQGDHGPSYAFRPGPKRRLRRKIEKLEYAQAEAMLKEPWVRPYWVERFGILNAYLLPPAAGSALHPAVSPVNTFRIIFNRYFEAELPLLPDRSLFAAYHDPTREFDLTPVLEGLEELPRP